MAVINKRVDDYLYNSKGEEVEGAKKRTLTIPAVMFGGTRSVKHTLDTSDKGDKALDRELEKLQDRIQQASADFLKNIGFDAKKHADRQNGKAEQAEEKSEDTAPEESEETPASTDADTSAEATESDEELSDEDLEAATNPSSSGFSSSNY